MQIKKHILLFFIFLFTYFSLAIVSDIYAQEKKPENLNKFKKEDLKDINDNVDEDDIADDTVRYYDCGKTGKCLDSGNELEALYAQNLIPGFATKQEWYLENKSKKSCRVYLRLKSLDDEVRLPEKITLSAFEVKGKQEKVIIDEIKFSELLEKQSVYLLKLPKKSTVNISWNILLDESVDNSFQAVRKKFSTLLYSYCLDDKKDNEESEGQVAGATTEKNNKGYIYIALATSSVGLLGLLKYKNYFYRLIKKILLFYN